MKCGNWAAGGRGTDNATEEVGELGEDGGVGIGQLSG